MGNGNEAQAEGGEANPPVALNPTAVLVTGYNNINQVFDPTTNQYSAPLGPTSYTAWPYRQPGGSEQQFSLGRQHQFSGSNLLTVGYVGMQARHLGRSRSLTQIPFGLGAVNVPALFGNPNGAADCDSLGNSKVQNYLINNEGSGIFFQPFPGYSGITMKENSAVASYNSLEVNFRHTFGHGLTFQTAYTWSHNIDNASDVWGTAHSGIDEFHLSRWRGTSDLNRAQILHLNYVYDLPFFKNARNSVVRQVLGGWTVGGITSFFTGQPVDFSCGVLQSDGSTSYNTGAGGGMRCNAPDKERAADELRGLQHRANGWAACDAGHTML